MAEWALTVFPRAYKAINQFGKRVEGRAPDPAKPEKDYRTMKVGDTVLFRAIPDEDSEPLHLPDMIFPVTFNHHYLGESPEQAINEMLIKEGLEALLPGFTSIDEGIEVYMSLPDYPRRIASWGIHAIGLGNRIK